MNGQFLANRLLEADFDVREYIINLPPDILERYVPVSAYGQYMTLGLNRDTWVKGPWENATGGYVPYTVYRDGRVEPGHFESYCNDARQLSVSPEQVDAARRALGAYVTQRMEQAKAELDPDVEHHAHASSHDDCYTKVLPKIYWCAHWRQGWNDRQPAGMYRAKMMVIWKGTRVLGNETGSPIVHGSLIPGAFISEDTAWHIAVRYNPVYETPSYR